MMNENIVTMSLEEYTKLIIENHDLREMVKGIKRKVENDIEEKIMGGRIDNLNTKEEIEKWLDANDGNLLSKFTNGYSYTWERISRDSYNIVNVKEVETLAVSMVKSCLNERLKEIIEDERDKNNE